MFGNLLVTWIVFLLLLFIDLMAMLDAYLIYIYIYIYIYTHTHTSCHAVLSDMDISNLQQRFNVYWTGQFCYISFITKKKKLCYVSPIDIPMSYGAIWHGYFTLATLLNSILLDPYIYTHMHICIAMSCAMRYGYFTLTA
jgi:hypothetical protein